MNRGQQDQSRREFLRECLWCGGLAFLGATGASLAARAGKTELVWQIDPVKCPGCGDCEPLCVKSVSAVKAYRAYERCGYCRLCHGYFRPGTKDPTPAVENRLCPNDAMVRKEIADGVFEYEVDESRCIGCGRCVDRCRRSGNGAMYLQVRQDLCLHCNDCALARRCPEKAMVRQPLESPYLHLKGSR